MRRVIVFVGLFGLVLAGCGADLVESTDEEQAASTSSVPSTTSTTFRATTTTSQVPTTTTSIGPTTTSIGPTTTTAAGPAEVQNRPPVIEDPGVTVSGLTIEVRPVVVDPDQDPYELLISIAGAQTPVVDGAAIGTIPTSFFFEPEVVEIEITAVDSKNAATKAEVLHEVAAEFIRLEIERHAIRFDDPGACFSAFTAGGWTTVERDFFARTRRTFGGSSSSSAFNLQLRGDSQLFGIGQMTRPVGDFGADRLAQISVEASLDSHSTETGLVVDVSRPLSLSHRFDLFVGTLCEAQFVVGISISAQ